jgi:hypothetical protein
MFTGLLSLVAKFSAHINNNCGKGKTEHNYIKMSRKKQSYDILSVIKR